MGLWDKIKRTVQKIVPGGKTGNEPATKDAGVPSFTDRAPSNAPTGSKITPSTNSPSQNISGENVTEKASRFSKEGISGQIDKAKEAFGLGVDAISGKEGAREEFTSRIDDQEKAVLRGLAVGGAAAVATSAPVVAAVRGLLSTGASASNVATQAAKLGVDPKMLQAAVDKRLFSAAATDLAKAASGRTFIGLTKKQLLSYGGALMGGAGITTWLASDNILSMAGTTINKIEGRFQSGQVTKEAALEQVDGQLDLIDKTKKAVDVLTLVNPLMWPFRNIFMDNANNVEATSEITRDFIATLPETEAAMYERLREESDARDAAYEEMRLWDQEQEEMDNEEWQRSFEERVTLDEAIRKRNAGIELTEEELAVLIKYGLDTKVVSNWNDDYGRSSLGFGGLF